MFKELGEVYNCKIDLKIFFDPVLCNPWSIRSISGRLVHFESVARMSLLKLILTSSRMLTCYRCFFISFGGSSSKCSQAVLWRNLVLMPLGADCVKDVFIPHLLRAVKENELDDWVTETKTFSGCQFLICVVFGTKVFQQPGTMHSCVWLILWLGVKS